MLTRSKVTFTAVIEWERDRAYPFDFKLLHSDASKAVDALVHPSSWPEVPLPRTTDSPSRVFTPEQACRHATFTATLTVGKDGLDLVPRAEGSLHGKFTFRYQHYPGSPFKEIFNPAGGAAFGEIIIPATTPTASGDGIEKLLALESGWSASPLCSLNKGSSAWRVTAEDNLPPSEAEDTVLTGKDIGLVVDQLRYMCIIRAEPFWYGAVHDGEYFHLSEHAILASFLTKSGQYISLLSFNGVDDFYQVFIGGPEGKVTLAGRNDSPSAAPLSFVAAVASDRQESIAEVMAQARQLNESTPKTQSLLEKALASASGSPEDDFFDNLGYCTWNGLGAELTEDKILNGLEKLTEAGVVFNTLLIDDNWQTLGNTKLDPSESGWRGWKAFQANKEGFPNGLSGLIKKVKERYPHIQYVGVWHAILGYWAGLSHDTELAKTYKTRMTRCKVRLSVTTDVLIVDPVDVHRMYDDFYAFLRSEGVDFVKTDVQHLLAMLVNPVDRQDVPAAYQSAWTTAYLKHFQGRAIGCMSQIPQVTFHSLLQGRTPRILVRNNDDFFPEIPGSHPLHIWTNAHNALLTQHLNTLPDWDMFQTSHTYSSYHGAARAISGGPVLITDTPGEHGTALINQMTATTPAGKQIALRPAVATALDFFESYAKGPILKVATSTVTGSGIIGTFNAGEGERESLIPYADFQRAAKSSEAFVVRSFRTGRLFTFDTPVSKLVKMKLEPRGWDILTASPVRSFGKSLVAVLGLLDKMSGAAGVTKVDVSESSVAVEIKALGNLGLFVGDGSTSVSKVVVDDEAVEEKYISSAAATTAGSRVFAIDVGAWWKDGKKTSDKKTLSVNIELSA
jgi:hypothetical protein